MNCFLVNNKKFGCLSAGIWLSKRCGFSQCPTSERLFVYSGLFEMLFISHPAREKCLFVSFLFLLFGGISILLMSLQTQRKQKIPFVFSYFEDIILVSLSKHFRQKGVDQGANLHYSYPPPPNLREIDSRPTSFQLSFHNRTSHKARTGRTSRSRAFFHASCGKRSAGR